MLQQHAQRVDDLDSLLRERTKRQLENLRNRISGIAEKLFLLSPGRELETQQHSLNLLQDRLTRAIDLLQIKLSDSVQAADGFAGQPQPTFSSSSRLQCNAG